MVERSDKNITVEEYGTLSQYKDTKVKIEKYSDLKITVIRDE